MPNVPARAGRPKTKTRASGVLARRRAALHTLDPMVRRLLGRRVAQQVPAPPSLTVYDSVYPATPQVGGHWTVATVRLGWWTHTVRSYAVSLLFDAAHRPRRFRISGAREVMTRDASEAALAEGLTEAAAAGPQETTTPLFPGSSL